MAVAEITIEVAVAPAHPTSQAELHTRPKARIEVLATKATAAAKAKASGVRKVADKTTMIIKKSIMEKVKIRVAIRSRPNQPRKSVPPTSLICSLVEVMQKMQMCQRLRNLKMHLRVMPTS